MAKPYQNRDWLWSKYVREEMTMAAIAKEALCSRRTIHRWLKRFQIPRRENRTYHWDYAFFDVWTKAMAYVLGFAFADGHVISNEATRQYYLSLSQNSRRILSSIARAVGGNEDMVWYDNKRDEYKLTLRHKRLPDTLASYGLTPHNSLIMPWPDPPKVVLPQFVRGFFDGDGCITHVTRDRWEYPIVVFASGSENFLGGLRQALYSEGLSNKRIEKWPRVFVLRYTAQGDVRRIYDLMYSGCDTLYLSRKRIKFESLLKSVEVSYD